MTVHRDPAKFWAESNLQCQIVSFLRQALPSDYRVLSIPNGRYAADPKTVARLKREGLFPGAPDLIVIRNDGWFCGFEVKAATGRLSSAQVEFGGWLLDGGGNFAVVRSLAAVVEELAEWGVPLRGRIAA